MQQLQDAVRVFSVAYDAARTQYVVRYGDITVMPTPCPTDPMAFRGAYRLCEALERVYAVEAREPAEHMGAHWPDGSPRESAFWAEDGMAPGESAGDARNWRESCGGA